MNVKLENMNAVKMAFVSIFMEGFIVSVKMAMREMDTTVLVGPVYNFCVSLIYSCIWMCTLHLCICTLLALWCW